MQNETGDDYIRRIASFIRTNERGLAEAVIARPRRAQRRPADPTSIFNPMGWLFSEPTAGTGAKPVVLSMDTHHLFYLLMRLEAIGIDIGTLDVRVDNPSRPLSYINIFPDPDKSETRSMFSIRSSLSVVSNLSLGGGWWGRSEPTSIDTELKYLFSSFTKLPALSISAPGRKMIAELANEPPNENAIPMDSFKNLQSLECADIDPRALLGWDKLAESLWSLKIRKSGLEDVSDIFIGAVLDDQARREGSTSRKRRRKIPQGPLRQTSFHSSQIPDPVPEDTNGEMTTEPDHDATNTSSLSSPPSQLSPGKWEWLKHLSLSDNALTFFPSELTTYLTALTHLDLSSNLLVSIPQGLGALHNLVSLNMSDNMIDSVLGIYQNLGQVLFLNLSHNRLESICGLERLHALERVDLRGNLIEESAEIGRLATLPNISDVWVEGNPLVELEEGYRVACFDYFWKEGKTVKLDGTSPSFYEKRNLTVPPSQQMTSSRPLSAAYSPPIIAVGHSHPHSRSQPTPPPPEAADNKPSPAGSSNPSPYLGPVSAVGVSGNKGRRKKPKRIVELDVEPDNPEAIPGHRRTMSTGSATKVKAKASDAVPSRSNTQEFEPFSALHYAEKGQPPAANAPTGAANDDSSPSHGLSPPELSTPTQERPPPVRRSRHSRFQTEYASSSVDDQYPVQDSQAFRRSRNSQTFSSRAAARRARVTASVYEPSTVPDDEEERSFDDGELFRRRIEALKKDMGEGWLKVFSQSQMKTPS
ncbi:hypothetical protein L218DRAFT_959454 [Marasmius fiardii PR-910]|nr:hypothetical protein L218DRAFT_959454 [Marasmius fiardii PR-910]